MVYYILPFVTKCPIVSLPSNVTAQMANEDAIIEIQLWFTPPPPPPHQARRNCPYPTSLQGCPTRPSEWVISLGLTTSCSPWCAPYYRTPLPLVILPLYKPDPMHDIPQPQTPSDAPPPSLGFHLNPHPTTRFKCIPHSPTRDQMPLSLVPVPFWTPQFYKPFLKDQYDISIHHPYPR